MDYTNIKLTNVEKLNRLVQFNIDFGITQKELAGLLEQEEWQVHPTDPFRYNMSFPKHEKLKEIKNFIMSNEFAKTLLNKFKEINPEILNHHGMSINEFYLKSDSLMVFHRDHPGCFYHLHRDPEKMIFGGVIYLTAEDDPKISTYFYSDSNKSDEFRIATNYGNGWLQFNDRSSWHEGGNNGNDIRYIILYSYHLNVCVNRKRLDQ